MKKILRGLLLLSAVSGAPGNSVSRALSPAEGNSIKTAPIAPPATRAVTAGLRKSSPKISKPNAHFTDLKSARNGTPTKDIHLIKRLLQGKTANICSIKRISSKFCFKTRKARIFSVSCTAL